MPSLTCIVCPIGCALDVTEDANTKELSVSGNKCPRGEAYAIEEIRAPKRAVTASCKIKNNENTTGRRAEVRRAPVKTSSPCMREKIPALLNDIYKMEIQLPVKMGDVIIAGWDGSEIDVIATRTIE